MRPLIVVASCAVLSLGLLVERAAAQCPADSVQSGTVCLDKYRGKRMAGAGVAEDAD